MHADSTSSPAASILLVDDMPANLQLLTDMLQARSYEVRPVLSGELALQAARRKPPQLILLDINMPGMNGYEVCKQLKGDPQLAAVPVIFISALDETLDKVKGFGLGAVDYVTKPFQFEEVEARVRTHLELARLRRELERHNVRLEETVLQRTRELAEAHARLAILDEAKSDFLHLISHEVRTPLSGIFGVAEMLLEICADNPEAADCPELFQQSRRRLMTLIGDALLLSQIGAGAAAGVQQQCRLEELLKAARLQVGPFAQSRRIQIAPAPPDLGLVHGVPDYLVRALQSLLETAVKFARSGTLVRISKATARGEVRLFIEADGRGIPPEFLPRFFQLLTIAEPITIGGDLGFGPAVAERIVTLYGGTVSAENLTPPGVRLAVCLKTPEAIIA
ncbi:MAG: hybrid sensor histidine kinase/response regulator [Planctomycetota bacterium]|nr:hybrid sensor histidine kinase/response regulator [Planctomycetota bacterium]